MEREQIELEVIKFNNFVDELEDVCGLTLFQIAFIKDVKYFNDIQGSFKFFKSYYVNKYEEVITEKQMIIEIDELMFLGLVRKDSKKTIYNGKFVTTITFTTRLDTKIGFWSGEPIQRIINQLDDIKDAIKTSDEYHKRLAAIDIHMAEKEIKKLNR